MKATLNCKEVPIYRTMFEKEAEEYYTLMNEYNVGQGIVYNKYSGIVIAFSYVREGINYYYKVVEE